MQKHGNNSRAGRIPATIFSLFLIFIFSLSLVTGLETYPTIGGENENFQLGLNTFIDSDSSISQLTFNARPLDSFLVYDLDNDGDNELIYIESNDGESYNYEIVVLDALTLTPIDAINMNQTNWGGVDFETTTNLELFDIGSDGLMEIVYALDNGRYPDYYKVNLVNNTLIQSGIHFSNKSNTKERICSSVTTPAPARLRNVLDCDEYICVHMCSNVDTGNYISYLSVFNEAEEFYFNTDLNTTTYASQPNFPILYEAGNQDGICFSNIRSIPHGDIDNDGTNEWVLSALKIDSGSSLKTVILDIDPNNLTDAISVYKADERSMLTTIESDTQVDCSEEGYSYMISPPLIAEADGFVSNGKEIFIALRTSSTGSSLWRLDKDLNLDDFYPITNTVNGEYVSNVIQTSIFGDSPNDYDFCFIGFNLGDEEEKELLCASDLHSGLLGLEHNIYEDSLGWSSNITITGEQKPYNLIHTITNTNRYNELTDQLITPYGIYEVQDYTDSDSLNSIYGLPSGASSVIMVDSEKIEKEDIYMYDASQGWYIDDGFTNSNCLDDGCLVNLFTNPCILDGEVIQNGTDINIRVIGEDKDSDDLNYMITLFDGASYEQNETRLNITSGNVVSVLFSLDGNVTNNGELKIEVWDSVTPSKIETETYSFIVANNGFEFGDVTCEDDLETTPSVDTPTDNQSAISNVLDDSMDDVQGLTGFSRQLIWYVVLLIILGGALYQGVKTPQNLIGIITLSVIFSFVWILVGTFLGYVPFAHFLVMLLVLFLGLGLFIVKILGMNNNGG